MRIVVPGLWAALSLAAISPALAGEFLEKDGVALGGIDPVAYFSSSKPVAGAAAHTFTYKGSVFQFATSANRDQFAAKPEQFAPQYGGFCAYATASGYKVGSDPEAFTVSDGKLYLNYSPKVRTLWSKDIPGFVAKADANWPAVTRLAPPSE
jgi:YHS domain-containing protein